MSKSIITGDDPDQCYLCKTIGEPAEWERVRDVNPWSTKLIQEHHIFGKYDRKRSEHYGLKVHLCIYHHTEGKEAVHNNAELNLSLKKIGQETFERKYGHDRWIQEFGKNYL